MGITAIPNSTTVLVIGGGPAGSYAAAVLAREGINVTLLEREYFPRYHIGESMLPSFNNFMAFIDAQDKVKKAKFVVKPGAAIKLNQYKREGYTDFIAFDPENSAWNLLRSEFDEILLRHAAECGARVYEGISVTDIQFSKTDPDQPISATWSSKSTTNRSGTISFDYLVDASGRTGIMSTKYLKTRKFNESLRNIAYWGYWTGAGMYMPGTRRENAPWFEALTDETGWAWFIPLHNGTVSVGVVMSEQSGRSKKGNLSLEEGSDRNTALYLEQLKLVPGLQKLLGQATFNGDLKTAGDYSYSSEGSQYAGTRYRIAGDAGAFIDPLFSSGVHLAFTGGLSAAATIAASIRGQCTEDQAVAFHNQKIGTSYTRFLVVVWAAYKQMKAQSSPVLADVDEDNFDRAFDFLRPVIQGATESDPTLGEKEVMEAMEFCEHAIAPSDPEMLQSVAQRLDPKLLTPDGPLLTPKAVESLTGEDEEAKQVLWKLNSDKALVVMFDYQGNFRQEVLNGMYVNLEKGNLGLVNA
ncbi:putative halogenase [Dendrothele bispora CBS 962.96]|uniref:Putative halogenase n=1 Tax=Dendrothele bispora (strain CBS 962.96) TaxID=1314807 RepID=A0A4S8LS34_DENBC|nr:putative halogenase [Dendrothele bispora CBS 962.96]